MLAAVNRFNVVSFWNTLTGKVIHKKVLEGHAQIEHAYRYRCHTYKECYTNLANQFNAFSLPIVSYKTY